MFIDVSEEFTASLFRWRNQAVTTYCLLVLYVLLSDLEDIGSTFLRNVGNLLSEYAASLFELLFVAHVRGMEKECISSQFLEL
jgi:hypothetical protein